MRLGLVSLAVACAVVFSCATGSLGPAGARADNALCSDAGNAEETYFERGFDWQHETRFSAWDGRLAALNMCRLGELPFDSVAQDTPKMRCLWYRALQSISSVTFDLRACRFVRRSTEWLSDGGASVDASTRTMSVEGCADLVEAISAAIDGGVGSSLLPPGEAMIDGDDVLYEHNVLTPKRRGIVEMPDVLSQTGAVGACNLIRGASDGLAH